MFSFGFCAKKTIDHITILNTIQSDEEPWGNLLTNMTPLEDFLYLLNAVLLGEEPTIEDFILLIGTIVAFVAFILWCCFPVLPKEAGTPSKYDSKSCGHFRKIENASRYEMTT